VKSLRSDLATTVSALPPLPDIHRYARTANHRRHYHRLRHWPPGLIAIGDAVCVFNPVYAQGMTVAALEALALRNLLRHRHRRNFTTRFQHHQARLTAWPWLLATIGDTGWHTEQPAITTRLAQWYLNRWRHHIPHDPTMFRHFAQLTNMLSGPTILFRPRHLARILLTGPGSD